VELSIEDLVDKWGRLFHEYFKKEIGKAALSGEKSFEMNYWDLDKRDPELAEFFFQHPYNAIYAAEEALKKIDVPIEPQPRLHFRIKGLPETQKIGIRDLRSEHLGKFLAIEGLVKKATEVRPKLEDAAFQCSKCGAIIKVPQEEFMMKEPFECYEDQGGCGRRSSFKLLTEESNFVDFQKIEVQENPEGLKGGAQPQRITIYLEDDLVGNIVPGDRVIINGALKGQQRRIGGMRLREFNIVMDACSIEQQEQAFEEVQITEEDEKKILDFSKDPNLYEKMKKSIAPTIYGMDVEKEALAFQLFGGVPKLMHDGTRIRGDIHVLFVGDPGTAKSQLLRYVAQLAPRSIYTSGKSSSAAGLCVSPDTLISLSNGEIVEIGKFVEKRMFDPVEVQKGIWEQKSNGVKLFTIGNELDLQERELQSIWKLKSPKNLIKVITRTNREITVSKNTPLLVKTGEEAKWIKARELKEGMHVATFDSDQTCIRWDKIRKVKSIESNSNYIYDLTVEKSHNFIANGVLVHNTASAVKDEFGEGRWTLEAGVLVLADLGISCIDEMDKMSQQDRSALHQAMEQQEISIAKAGINATLKARCALLGAANPKLGRFDEYMPIADQINLPPALLSRFDLIFPITDKPNREKDELLASHILRVHKAGELLESGKKAMKALEELEREIKPLFEPEFFRKYIAYAKRNIYPVMTDEALERIKNYYVDVRGSSEEAVPFTPRQLEAFIRIAEASARVRLSDEVTIDDANRSIRIVEYYLKKVGLDIEKGIFDIDVIATGISRSQHDRMRIIIDIIRKICGKSGLAPRDEIIREAEGEGIEPSKAEEAIMKMKRDGLLFEPKTDSYKLTGG
jgi:replicative DNA helicase Mcm